jgi:hypothetical protein
LFHRGQYDGETLLFVPHSYVFHEPSRREQYSDWNESNRKHICNIDLDREPHREKEQDREPHQDEYNEMYVLVYATQNSIRRLVELQSKILE